VNVGSLLARHARYRTNHLAVVCGQHRCDFGEVYARVNRFANALRGLGLKKGDTLAIVLPNCIELLDAYRACAQLGVVSVPLSPLLRGAGLVTLLRDSDTTAVLACGAVVDALEAAKPELPSIRADRYILTDCPSRAGYRDYQTLVREASDSPAHDWTIADDDIYNIIYSSGTTGQPKGIIHTHYVRAMYGSLFAAQFRVGPESVAMHAGSLVFNGSFVTLMSSWFVGCTFILQERFDAVEFIETVERERVTHVMMVPSQIVAVLNAPNFSAEKLASLEMLCSVGAPWHREHKERMLAVLPTSLYELYGLTEGFITVLDRTEFARKIDSVGVPIAFSEMRILDDQGRDVPAGTVGEIVGRSPLMMPGYYKQPELTAQALRDDWLFTGDLGAADVNVYPKDIEEIAVQHPAIREVAVFGVPSERWGESPVAAVVLHAPIGATAGELKSWINERVAARYQQLSDILLVDDLPRSTAGKTLKRVLREQYASAATALPAH
jgi:acyl-CoA synthetase (AMP-forming)/AMP-acid ligase II